MPDDLLPQLDVTNIHAAHDTVDPPIDAVGPTVNTADGTKLDSAKRSRLVVAGNVDHAKNEIVRLIVEALESGEKEAREGASTMDLERGVGARLVPIAQRMIAFVFASACQAAMIEDLRKRGLRRDQTRLRTDEDGYATVNSTFGPITFPTFAYRDLWSPMGSVIRHPAAKIFPYHRACRSTPLCLEWEARLGAQHPFRKAEELFCFFTRGASTVEDTTIARHMLALSSMVEPSWLYRKPEDVRQNLRENATRDQRTGRPIFYSSCDAHALRRYAGDTWATEWKMANGIRLWCEDKNTGAIIHLGGEFTWGDCNEVESRFRDLIAAGILPNNSEAWREVDAQLLFVSDGSEWFNDHILPVLPDAIPILDPYHVFDWFAIFARLVFGVGTKHARALHRAVREVFFGEPTAKDPNPRKRRGHKKKRQFRLRHAHDQHRVAGGRRPRGVGTDTLVLALVDVLASLRLRKRTHLEARDKLVERLSKNAHRMDYPGYLARGFQVGSGAMESLHRNGSQQRLKVPGARWLEETSKAVLQFRMLELSGRWNEFWNRVDIADQIATAFAPAAAPVPQGVHEVKEAA